MSAPSSNPTTVPAPALLCNIVTPVGMLGYGFEETELEHGLELALQNGAPTAIILDSGSTDSGPGKLALGTTTTPRSSYVRDLRKLITGVKKYHVPLIISSAGGDGSNAHVTDFLKVISEIVDSPDARPNKLKVIAIYSEIEQHVVLEKLQSGKISGCGPCVPALTTEDVTSSTTIVGQMGPEPFLQAMIAYPDFDIMIGGRAYDPAPYVAFCAFQASKEQYRPPVFLDSHIIGGYTHMGKIMECGGLCATPKSKSAMATIYQDGTFDIRPLSPGSVCTPVSVAAHTLYEKTRPDQLHGPGGNIFVPSHKLGQCYTLKLEGAKVAGYRTFFMGSFADPILISQLPAFLKQAKWYAGTQIPAGAGNWELDFHTYGLGQTQSSTRPNHETSAAGEVFIVGEALAESQDLARSIASAARVACIHGPYKEQKATSGNLGMGIAGMTEIDAGPCAEFSIYHLMELEEGEEEGLEAHATRDASVKESKHGRKLIEWEMLWIGTGDRVKATLKSDGTKSSPQQSDTKTHPKSQSEKVIARPPGPIQTLGDAADVIRSKNAGPYEITFDVIFGNKAVYDRIKNSGVLDPRRIAQLYNIPIEDVIYCGFFDPAMAFKATIPRIRNGKPTASGGYMENDVHGSQQYLPLMNIPLDIEL